MRGLWYLIVHQFTTCLDTHVRCNVCMGRGCHHCGMSGRVCPRREPARDWKKSLDTLVG